MASLTAVLCRWQNGWQIASSRSTTTIDSSFNNSHYQNVQFDHLNGSSSTPPQAVDISAVRRKNDSPSRPGTRFVDQQSHIARTRGGSLQYDIHSLKERSL